MKGSDKALKISIVLLIFIFVLVSKSLAGSDFKMIDTAQLHSMIVDNAYKLEGRRARQFTVIDARTKEEYDEAHIFSAINIPEKNFEKLTDLLPKYKGALLVVYCNSMKSGASRKWADKAKTAGYTNIVIYSEGFPVWTEKNMPIAPVANMLKD